MTQVFNSTFEASLRVMLILFSSKTELSLTQIAVYDFAATYGSDFSISNNNLHGRNDFRFCEYAVKREKIKSAIKELVLYGYVVPQFTNNGLLYFLSENGVTFCQKLNDEYANKYIKYVKQAIIIFSDYSDIELTKMINQRAISVLGGQ